MKVRDLWVTTKINQGLSDAEAHKLVFIDALNKVRIDVNRRYKESYSELTTAAISANTDLEWEDYFDNAVKSGVKYYLQRDGATSGEPDPTAKDFYYEDLRKAMAPAMTAADSMPTRTQPAE